MQRHKWYTNKRFLVVSEVSDFRLLLQQQVSTLGPRELILAKSAPEAYQSYQQQAFDFVICDNFLDGNAAGAQKLLQRLIEQGHYRFRGSFIVCCPQRHLDSLKGHSLIYSADEVWVGAFNKEELRQRLDNLIVRKAALRPIEEALDYGHLTRAVELAQEKVGRVPKLASNCLRIMARTLLQQGNYSQALQVYQRVLAATEQHWALLGQGICQLELGAYLDTVETLERLLQRQHDGVVAYFYLAEALTNLGEYRRAYEWLQRAVEIDPSVIEMQRKLARLALQLDDMQCFAQCYRRIIVDSQSLDEENSPEDMVNYARALFAMFVQSGPIKGQRFLSELNEVLRTQQRRFADNPQIILPYQLIQARMLAHSKSEQQANRLIDSVIGACMDLEPELLLREEAELTVNALPQSTSAQQLHQQVNAGISVLQPVVPDADKGQQLNHEGMQLFEQQQLRSARQRFIDAFRYAPDNVSIALNLLQTLLKLMEHEGRNDDDIERCRRCVLTAQNLAAADNRRHHLDVLQVKLNELRYRRLSKESA